MRREHKSHVIIIAFMMLIIAAVFTFVILHKPTGTSGITTYIPPTPETGTPISAGSQIETTSQQPAKTTSSNIGTNILIAFLIILALLFICYLAIKIAKELRGH
jgi:cytochrome oxidase Cu insertion factor (SCO1/SenC/PrrC family)